MQPPPSNLNPSSTIPPFLAYLPTAFASPQPPPGLLELLSPILRQRVQLLSEAPSTTSWLPLLNWDTHESSQLTEIIESANLEPHPVSGEIELGQDPEAPKYRRIDEETLQAVVRLPDAELAVVYVWATADNTQDWRVSELKPLRAGWQGNPAPWEDSIRAAENAFESKTNDPLLANLKNENTQAGDEEDDGYWDQYDATPGRTPARTPSAPLQQQRNATTSSRHPTGSNTEDNYWGQYGSVQPALDAEDPDEKADNGDVGQSTLNGNTLLNAGRSQSALEELEPLTRIMFSAADLKNDEVKADGIVQPMFTPNGTNTADSGVAFGLQAFLGGRGNAFAPGGESFEHIAHPRPRSQSAHSSSSGKSALVEQLEDQVESSQAPRSPRKNSVVAETAIQQHISTSLKSLYRLAKVGGIQRSEFERIVQSELGVLGMMDDD